MNYSKDSRAKAEKKNSTRSKRVKKKGKVTAFRMIVIVLIISFFAVIGGGLGVLIGIIKSAPDASTLSLKPDSNFTSFVYDREGNQIDTFVQADNRIYVPLSQMPEDLQHAFIALEDERFYTHNGIDIKGIFRALVANLKSGTASEGASTLTQQLIKNNVLTNEKSIKRKIQEQYLAIQFEKRYSKDTILEYYLNTIALGEGVSGVQAAANRYFNKDVSQLSLTESAVIAVITQAPTRYNPIRNQENNWEKVKVALNKMEEQGYITATEKAAALEENPYDDIQEVHKEFTEKSTRSYFVDEVYRQVLNDLQEKAGYSEEAARILIYGGGLEIYTTMDSEMQKIADKYINDESLYPSSLYKLYVSYSVSVKKSDGTTENYSDEGLLSSRDELETFKANRRAEWGITENDTYTESCIEQPQPQASFVLMDYSNGQVMALSGGRGDKTNLGFNYATQAKRQPGSTFKVLAAYAPALDTGKLEAGSTLIDEPYSVSIPGSSPYTPNNWYSGYDGKVSLRRAIARSMNILAVKTVAEYVGIDTAYQYLLNFGFTTLSDSDRVYALPLGGITNGVTALELNAAYGTIANNGMYRKPIFYTKVKEKSTGRIILDNTTAEADAENSHVVLKSSTAQLLTDIMQDVVTGANGGTGSTVKKYFSSLPVAGKTGTTSDDKDLLFAGYTPYYVATIWTGYETPAPLSSGGGSYHLAIWGQIMNEITNVKGLEYKAFPKVDTTTSGTHEVKICNVSGKLATALCEEHGTTTTEYFTDGTAPTDYCDVHVEVNICTISGKVATEYCPEETVVKQSIVRQIENGVVVPDEICDVHGSDSIEITETPLPSDENINDSTSGENLGTLPESSPPDSNSNTDTSVPPASQPSAEPSLPPVVDPSPSPNPDDESGFFVPQQ